MKCGECLMERVQIVDLVDGVCPKCGTDYRGNSVAIPRTRVLPAKLCGEELTYEELNERIANGDWEGELRAAWNSGSRTAVAQVLNEPDLDHFVLAWFIARLADDGGDLDELQRAMEAQHEAKGEASA